MASAVIATQRYLIQNIVSPVRYVMRKKTKFGAVWHMKTCLISLPLGRKGIERSTRSCRDPISPFLKSYDDVEIRCHPSTQFHRSETLLYTAGSVFVVAPSKTDTLARN